MKAFATHFITAVIYILMTVYVIGDEDIETRERFLVAFLFLCAQLVAFAICCENEFYKANDSNPNKNLPNSNQ